MLLNLLDCKMLAEFRQMFNSTVTGYWTSSSSSNQLGEVYVYTYTYIDQIHQKDTVKGGQAVRVTK